MTWSVGGFTPFIGSRVASCVAILVRVCHQMTNLCKLKIKRTFSVQSLLLVVRLEQPPKVLNDIQLRSSRGRNYESKVDNTTSLEFRESD